MDKIIQESSTHWIRQAKSQKMVGLFYVKTHVHSYWCLPGFWPLVPSLTGDWLKTASFFSLNQLHVFWQILLNGSTTFETVIKEKKNHSTKITLCTEYLSTSRVGKSPKTLANPQGWLQSVQIILYLYTKIILVMLFIPNATS